MKERDRKLEGSFAAILIGCMALAGCGDGGSGEEDADAADDGATEEISDPEVDDAAEIPPDDGGGGEDLIEDEGGGVTLTVLVQEKLSDGAMSPIEGATVALDAPGGDRTEDFSAADGRVTFTGLDFSLGLATATAHKEGYYLKSLVTAEESDGEIEITLLRDISDSLVEISGTAENMNNIGHGLFVSTSTTPYSAKEFEGPAWSTMVSPDMPFSLPALEFVFRGLTGQRYSFDFFGWTVIEHEAIAEPTTVAIDFSTPAATTEVQGSFALPSRPECPLRDSGFSLVHVRADLAYAGFSFLTDISDDGESYDYEVQYVEVPGTGEIRSEYVAYDSRMQSARMSYVVVSGLPAAGANDFGHLDVPNMIRPEGPFLVNAQPLHDPMEWEIFDSGVTVIIRVYRTSHSFLVPYLGFPDWEIELPVDSTTAVIPELPSTVNAEEFFSEPMLFGRVWLHQEPDSGEVLERWSSGIRFYLAP